MHIIGIIGGMSWESTAVYYRRLNELVREQAGGLHSARVLLASVDFALIAEMQKDARWDDAEAYLIELAFDLKRGGADFLVLATNTMHKVADTLASRTGLPFIDIRDVTVLALKAAGKKKPLLLGTRFTMEDSFYTGRLFDRGFDVVVPSDTDRKIVHDIIYNELCCGIVSTSSKAKYLEIINSGRAQGIDSVIFGCTEIGMLLSQSDIPEGAFDTTELHVAAAVERAMAKQLTKARTYSTDTPLPKPDWPAGLGPPVESDGYDDAVSFWRLQNMTQAERDAFLGPPRKRNIFNEKKSL